MYKNPHPQASSWMKYQLSTLWCAKSGKLFIGKMGRIYVLKIKNKKKPTSSA